MVGLLEAFVLESDALDGRRFVSGLVERGDSVTVVAITGGQTTHDEQLADELRKAPGQRDAGIIDRSQEEYAQGKAREFEKVCGVFGITDVRVLPFSDHPLEVTDDAVAAASEALYDVCPHLILTQARWFRLSGSV